MKFIKKTVEKDGYTYLLEHVENCLFDPTFIKEKGEERGYWKFDFELGKKIIDYTIYSGNVYSFENRVIRDVDISILRIPQKDFFKDHYFIEGDIFIEIEIKVIHKIKNGDGFHKAQVNVNQWKILTKEKKEV